MSNKRKISLTKPYVSEEAIKSVADTLRSGWIGQGPQVRRFEERFCKYIKGSHAVAVNSSAAAIRLALAISGVEPGDEVITTPLMWQATNHPILEQFAKPIFADVQYLTGNLNPQDIEPRITEKTKVILCAHWAGYPADLDEINNIAKKHNLSVIEEAAEALGSKYHGSFIGTLSRFTAFSFYAVQICNSVEGGMLTMSNESDYEAAMRRRWFGIDRLRRKPRIDGYYDYDVTEPGYGYPLNDVAAAMGLAHLKELEILIKRRRSIADIYRQELATVGGLTLFEASSDRSSNYQLFTMHVENRDGFCRLMRDRGIDVSVMHVRNDQYMVFGGLRDDLPILDRFSNSYINIPMHNFLTDEDVSYVVSSIKQGWH